MTLFVKLKIYNSNSIATKTGGFDIRDRLKDEETGSEGMDSHDKEGEKNMNSERLWYQYLRGIISLRTTGNPGKKETPLRCPAIAHSLSRLDLFSR